MFLNGRKTRMNKSPVGLGNREVKCLAGFEDNYRMKQRVKSSIRALTTRHGLCNFCSELLVFISRSRCYTGCTWKAL